jgi:hypothetical protein
MKGETMGEAQGNLQNIAMHIVKINVEGKQAYAKVNRFVLGEINK